MALLVKDKCGKTKEKKRDRDKTMKIRIKMKIISFKNSDWAMKVLINTTKNSFTL